jgi:anaerobic ribonucleoside-triphosphate reductase activating protein
LEEVKERKPEIINNVDYLKVGRYIAELGGLNKKATNQKMYRINQKTRQLEDITNKFFKS